jgi:hypothetical protein
LVAASSSGPGGLFFFFLKSQKSSEVPFNPKKKKENKTLSFSVTGGPSNHSLSLVGSILALSQDKIPALVKKKLCEMEK